MLMVISQETYEIDKKKIKKFLTSNSISCTLLKIDQSRSLKTCTVNFFLFFMYIYFIFKSLMPEINE
jgi:hypothetical protein